MRLTTFLYSSLGVVALLGAYIGGSWSANATPPAKDQGAEVRLPALGSQRAEPTAASMIAKRRPLARQQMSAKPPERPELAENAGEAEEQAASSPADTPPAVQSHEERYFVLDSDFQADAPDPGWAIDAERTIRSSLVDGFDNPARVVDAQCRGTMCKVTLEHDNMHAARDYSHAYLTDGSWKGPIEIVRHVDEPGRGYGFTYYFYRASEDATES